jgi:paraquat-inducible protein A
VTTDAETAADRDLASCHTCCKLSPASLHHCPRCGATLHLRITDSLQRTLALLITACVLYIPANVYPIMITEYLGVPTASTIMGGVVVLVQLGSIPVAAVIFIASVAVPLAKIVALFYLTWSVDRHRFANPRQRTRIYVIAEFIGKWSMIDVFVVAILVALVQLQGLLAFYPGIAAYSFAGVVVVTMLAAENFDSRLIWDQLESKKYDNSKT